MCDGAPSCMNTACALPYQTPSCGEYSFSSMLQDVSDCFLHSGGTKNYLPSPCFMLNITPDSAVAHLRDHLHVVSVDFHGVWLGFVLWHPTPLVLRTHRLHLSPQFLVREAQLVKCAPSHLCCPGTLVPSSQHVSDGRASSPTIASTCALWPLGGPIRRWQGHRRPL